MKIVINPTQADDSLAQTACPVIGRILHVPHDIAIPEPGGAPPEANGMHVAGMIAEMLHGHDGEANG